MAIRKIYRDSKGLYFKGEGFKFYIDKEAGLCEGDKVTVMSVSCGQAAARATYLDRDGNGRGSGSLAREP